MADFNEFENLQRTFIQLFNRLVNKDFRTDIDATGDPFEFTDNETMLKYTCLIKDNDTASMMILRLMLFFFIRNDANLQPVYGIPMQSFNESTKFKPQIRLFFSELPELVEEGYSPVHGEINWCLVKESSTTLTEAELKNIAIKIKANFAPGDKPIIWERGNKKYTYLDKDKGFDFRMLAASESEARDIMQRIFNVSGYSADWTLLTEHLPNKTSINRSPGTNLILGKPIKKSRYRPRTRLRFRYAEALIHGLPKGITLLDYTNRRYALID